MSSSRIRELVAEGDVEGAASLLGRPVEVEGTVVTGDARGGTLGFPTANLDVRPELLVPANGIYAGAAGEHRAAVSIGTNPHYGGHERRVEAHLLDFSGDLYGRRLVVELWQRLRDELAFESENELIAQIGRDVEAARSSGISRLSASFCKLRNLFPHDREAGSRRAAEVSDRDRPLPLLRRCVRETGERWDCASESRVPGVRVRRLGARFEPHTTRASPLLRGSPAAPFRVTALTPPK